MDSRFTRYAGFTILGIGILFFLAGILFTPGFIASHFSSDGILGVAVIQAIHVLELLAFCIGLLAIVLGLNLTHPIKTQKILERILPLGEKLDNRKFYLPFCFTCACIALAIGLLITKWGPNLSPDSVNYIFTAENIYNGIGFQEFMHHPLYPVLIAGVMHLGCDAMQAARLIPVMSFALFVFPVFYLGKTSGNVVIGYVVCLICLTLAPLLRLASYAWVDMPYILLSTISLLFIVKYARSDTGKITILCIGAFFTALATITCLYGIALLLTGLIVIIIKNISRLKKAFLHAILFGFISVLPISLWICRNIVLFSKPTAGGYPPESQPIVWLTESTRWLIKTINGDLFQPLINTCYILGQFSCVSTIPGFCRILIPLITTTLIALLVIYVIVSPTQRKALTGYLQKVYPVLLYIAIHLSGFVIGGIFILLLFSNRYTSTLYPLLILAGVYFIFHLYKQIKRPPLKPFLFSLITIIIVFFLTLQALNIHTYYETNKNGLGFNSIFWRNNQAITWINNNIPKNTIVYSNNVWGIRLRIDNPTEWLPYAGDEESIDQYFEMLKSSDDLYIVGFKERYRKGRNPQITNEEIIQANQKYNILTAVADLPEATIWHVQREQ